MKYYIIDEKQADIFGEVWIRIRITGQWTWKDRSERKHFLHHLGSGKFSNYDIFELKKKYLNFITSDDTYLEIKDRNQFDILAKFYI